MTDLYTSSLPSKWILHLKIQFLAYDSKSGLEKIFLKFLHAGDYFSLLHKSVQNHKFSNKNNHLTAWRDYKIIFSRPLFTIVFRTKNIFLDTCFILSVKTIYESVKYLGCVKISDELWIYYLVQSSQASHQFSVQDS